MIGGGTMGAGIAQVLLEAGCEVVLVEADAEAAERARGRVADGLGRRKNVDPAEIAARAARLRTATGFEGPLDVDLVVEAIPEIPAANATCWPRRRR